VQYNGVAGNNTSSNTSANNTFNNNPSTNTYNNLSILAPGAPINEQQLKAVLSNLVANSRVVQVRSIRGVTTILVITTILDKRKYLLTSNIINRNDCLKVFLGVSTASLTIANSGQARQWRGWCSGYLRRGQQPRTDGVLHFPPNQQPDHRQHPRSRLLFPVLRKCSQQLRKRSQQSQHFRQRSQHFNELFVRDERPSNRQYSPKKWSATERRNSAKYPGYPKPKHPTYFRTFNSFLFSCNRLLNERCFTSVFHPLRFNPSTIPDAGAGKCCATT